jgi:hypothetical protein
MPLPKGFRVPSLTVQEAALLYDLLDNLTVAVGYQYDEAIAQYERRSRQDLPDDEPD